MYKTLVSKDETETHSSINSLENGKFPLKIK